MILKRPLARGWLSSRRTTAARAHDGDPQGGRVAQIVRGSSVRAPISPLRLGGEMPDGEPVRAVTAIMAALDAVRARRGMSLQHCPGRGCPCRPR